MEKGPIGPNETHGRLWHGLAREVADEATRGNVRALGRGCWLCCDQETGRDECVLARIEPTRQVETASVVKADQVYIRADAEPAPLGGADHRFEMRTDARIVGARDDAPDEILLCLVETDAAGELRHWPARIDPLRVN